MIRIKGRKILSVLLIIICLLLAMPSLAIGSSHPPKVILVVIDQVTLDELNKSSYQNIRQMLRTGTVGIMNTNTARERIPDNTYLTIGTGNRVAGRDTGQAYNSWELVGNKKAGEIYKQRTGINARPENVLHIGVEPLNEYNKNLNYKYEIGFLGTVLHEAGLKTAVLVNSDIDNQANRQIASIVMDNRGLVDFGDVSSNILIKDTSSVIGKRTDYEKLDKTFTHLYNISDLIAIDLGDTSRVENASQFAFRDIIDKEKRLSLERADVFLGSVLKKVNLKRDMVILISPSPAKHSGKNTLTPLIIAGGTVKQGLATSDTTKRPGIITNTDIISTILQFYQIKQPAYMTGQPIWTVAEKNSVSYLLSLNKQIVDTYTVRPIILYIYRILSIISVILGIIILKYKLFKLRFTKILLLSVIAFPPAILLAPLVPAINTFTSVAIVLLLLIIFTTMGSLTARKNFLTPVAFMGLLTALLLDLDLMLGSPLIKTSVLGYDPMSGARYYGIGNEYMGVLIGALIIGITALMYKWPQRSKSLKIITLLLFLFNTYLMAAPNQGTNAGGTISAVAGFLVTYLLLCRVKFTKKNIILVATGIIVVTTIFIAMAVLWGGTHQSHIARTVNLIREEGYGQIIDIVVRKARVNLRLIARTQWPWLYAVNLAVALIALLNTKYNSWRVKYNFITKGLAGIVVGSIIALVFNDSGIVAAATMAPYAAVPALLVALEEINVRGDSN